jgi:hypothetical protein
MRELCARWPLATPGGGSPSAGRGGRQAWESARLERAVAWEPAGGASGEKRESMGAVDETFLARMILVCMDLATGSRLLEAGADDRTSPTWKAMVEERLTGLGTGGWAMVSDRAQALLQRAAQGLEGRSRPDGCHGIPAIVQSSALACGHRRRHAQQARTPARAARARRQEGRGAAQASREARALGPVRQADVPRWEAAPHRSRGHWERLALTRPPFHLADSPPPTAAPVERQRTAPGEAIEACVPCHPWPTRHDAMAQVRQ